MRWLSRLRRRGRDADDAVRTRFQCNLCGKHNEVAPERLGREIPSCTGCGSTVRWRAIVHLVCTSLRGLGLSDDACVADALASGFDYTNTYDHMAPQLDIADAPAHLHGTCDFLS